MNFKLLSSNLTAVAVLSSLSLVHRAFADGNVRSAGVSSLAEGAGAVAGANEARELNNPFDEPTESEDTAEGANGNGQGNAGNPTSNPNHPSNNGRRVGKLGKQTSKHATDADCDLDLDIQLFDDTSALKFKPDNKACKKGKRFVGSCNNGKRHVTLVPSVGLKGTFTASVTDDDTGAIYSISPDASGEMFVVETMSEDYDDELDPIDLDDDEDEEGRKLESDTNLAFSSMGLRGSNKEDGSHRSLQTNTVIDVLVVWTAAAECRNSGQARGCSRTAITSSNIQSRINLAIQETNAAYDLSGVNLELNLVRAEYVSYTESGNSSTDLGRLRGTSDGYMDNVHALRTQYGADMVALISDMTNGCGIGYSSTNTQPYNMFTVTHYSCATGNYSFAHELGHNMGCQHDKGTKGVCSTSSYNYGYRDPQASFRSILSYNCDRNPCPGETARSCRRVQRFSNTYSLYGGKRIGTSAINNARRINEVKNTIANFYSRRQTPAPTPAPPTSCSSSQVPLKVSIKTDNYPLETSYTVTNTCSNTVVASVGQGSITAKGAEYSKTYCVPPSTYTFKINDSYGDGICCGYGSGSYTVSYGSDVVASGGQFGSTASASFGQSCGGGGGTTYCGGCPTCTQQVWDALATDGSGSYTCGARITWLQSAQGYSEGSACAKVEEEFPSTCTCGCNNLRMMGDNGLPADAFPLGQCEGDCDSDSQCAGNLRCFFRSGTEAIPGCSGTGVSGKDYCVAP